ncbi:MAG: alpha/beta fold hydrolase [Algoriphagus sp.]|nr:alpha/beta fold hydrolase [Algoriphagus sp.]
MTNYLIVPGLGNSGPGHWQTFFENSGPNFIRIQQQDWEAPACEDWIRKIDQLVSKYPLSSVILIGHSMGCTAIAHWAKKYQKEIKGALLVAPSDLEAPVYSFPATGFTPIPQEKFNFRTIVVASENDEWVSPDRARFFAANWGSEFISLGKAGHINVASGYGDWKEGLVILKKLE